MQEGGIFETSDGSHSIFSTQYGVSYHSRYGAVQESRHVFLEAGLYPLFLSGAEEVAVLETGLGTGLNALLTGLEAAAQKRKVYYLGLEAYPISPEQAKALNYPAALGEGAAELFTAIHEMPWGKPAALSHYFTFEKQQSRFEAFASMPKFDVIYFDAFAPNAQPELWGEEVLGRMYQALKPGGRLVTYCAKGAVKRCMKGLGFTIEALPGPPGKREMTRALKPKL